MKVAYDEKLDAIAENTKIARMHESISKHRKQQTSIPMSPGGCQNQCRNVSRDAVIAAFWSDKPKE